MASENGTVQQINQGYESEQSQLNGHVQSGIHSNENEAMETNQLNGHVQLGNQGNENDQVPADQTNGHVGSRDGGTVAQMTVPGDPNQTVVPEQPAQNEVPQITEADPTHVVVVTQTSTEPLCHEPSGENEAKAACVLGFLVFLLCGGLFGLSGMIIAFFADRAYKKGRYGAARSRRNASVACSIVGVAVFMVTLVIIIIIFTRRSRGDDGTMDTYKKLSE